MSAAVCFALSCYLLLRLAEGLAEVAALAVVLATFFFPLLGGLTPFPLSMILLFCPLGATFET